MTKPEFEVQMNRLTQNWPNNFNAERTKLIWTAVHQHSIFWFEKLVTDMIANNRQAPLPTEFIEASSKRDRTVYIGSNFNNQPHPRDRSVFSIDEITEIF